MSGFNAAREQDDIAHTASEGWLIAGAIGGALVAAAALAVTGGAALVVVSAIAAGACTGGGLGELLGSMAWAPRHISGQLTSGSPDVYINNRPAIRAHLSVGACSEHSGSPQRVAEGSANVFINGYPAARIGDRLTCSAEIFSGSPDVFIGGDKVQTDDISPEIPQWSNWAMLGVGGAALAVLASPAVALLGTLGGMGGGYAGSYFGSELFGEGSDAQKWMLLAGSLAGGAAGGKGGIKFDAWRQNRLASIEITPLSNEKINAIVNVEKGRRPPPESYLPESYIKKHNKAFKDGASRIITRSSFEEYGLGKPDAGKSEFVLTKDNAIKILNETYGDPVGIAKRLGVSEEQLKNDSLVHVEFKNSKLYSPKIPTGNEWGANTKWIPGGRLPQGDLEAVVHTEGMINGKHYIVTDISTGEIL